MIRYERAGSSKKAAASKSKKASAKAKTAGKSSAREREKANGTQKQDFPHDRTGERKLTVPAVIEALQNSGGIKTAAARMLNVHRATLHKFINEHEELQDTLSAVEDEVKDLAETQMLKAIRDGDMQTVRWFLELKAKDRGYVRRVENTGPGGGPIETRTKPDLSGYTEDELEKLVAIEEAREARLREAAKGK